MYKDKSPLAVNVIAQTVSFTVQLLVSFFLTPFIVGKLGVDAYGFIGLADNFVMYAQLITIALNSMAGRFITIAYHKGDIKEVNLLFSSVFYANVVISSVILLVSILTIAYLEYIVDIPIHLLYDVKILFTLIFLNFIISVIFSTFQVATFIKNRLDLNAIRNVTSNLIKVSLLIVCFGLFISHLWYVGLATLCCTSYISLWNIHYTKVLTPEIKLSLYSFRMNKVRTVVSSGLWNTLTKLGNTFAHGFDLLFANLFIDAVAMGSLSITKRIPVIILGLITSICAAFAPSLTKLYAQGMYEEMKRELLASVRLAGFVSIVPCCFIFSLGDTFYSLWVPTEDSYLLYWLTIIGMLALPIAMSLEGVQNIFTVANKVKIYSCYTLFFNCMVFVCLFLGIRFVPVDYRLFYLVGVSTFWSFVRVGVFLPVYGALCVYESKTFFYPSILRVIAALLISVSVTLIIKHHFVINTWFSLIVVVFVMIIISSCVGSLIILNKNDREKVLNMMLRRTR